jgi:hypothetical protein
MLIMAIASSAVALEPNTNVDIVAIPSTVPVGGGTIVLKVIEMNTGDIVLSNIYVRVFKNGDEIAYLLWPPDEDSGNGDNMLDPGEAWIWWLLDIVVTEATLFSAIGIGLDEYYGFGAITCPDYPTECDEVSVDIDGIVIQPPVAQVCECGQYEYDRNEDIPLDGTCSYHPDPERNIVLYEWDLDNDGVYDVTGPTTTITGGFPSAGYWPVLLRVTDDNPVDLGGVQTNTHACQILVQEPSHCPHASANGPYLGWINEPIIFDASASWDPDNEIVLYEWDLDGDGQFDDATGVTVEMTWAAPYTGVVGLRVTDSPYGEFEACSDEDFSTVEIGNHAPVADAGGPYFAQANETITLDGSGSYDIDPGDSIVSYEWDLDDDGMYDDASGSTPSFMAGGIPGTLDVTCLKVTDSFGETDIDCTTVEVAPTQVDVDIDIYPNRVPNRVFLSRNYTLYVAVLGSDAFDVTTWDSSTVRFGRTDTEARAVRAPVIRDVIQPLDGIPDAMYGFMTFDCGFELTDTIGWLKGKTTAGTNVAGSVPVLVSP